MSLQNLTEGTSERIIDIKGFKYYTVDSWRACIYILGKLKKKNVCRSHKNVCKKKERLCKMLSELAGTIIHCLPLGKKYPQS